MSAAKKIRVDYSLLVHHLQLKQTRQANELLKEVIPRLVEYLRVTMGADEMSAKESVHQAFLNVHERIIKNKIRDPKSILGYMMQASRNAFLNHKMKENKFKKHEFTDREMVEPAMQIEELIEQERMETLELCINHLDDDSREFITYFLHNPGIGSKQVATHFGLSEVNVRTKKSRLVAQLHEMYQQKYN